MNKMSEIRTIGILGGGQLGRMSILAGRHLGFRFVVFEPSPECTAGQVADRTICASYDDLAALEAFAQAIDVASLEFENVPKPAADLVASWVPLRPSSRVLSICQHRQREKEYLLQAGFPCARFQVAHGPHDLSSAIESIGLPCVVKTAAFGYDGKGQVMLDSKAVDPDAL